MTDLNKIYFQDLNTDNCNTPDLVLRVIFILFIKAKIVLYNQKSLS